MCSQVPSGFSSIQFETLHRYHKHIENTHVTFCTQNIIFDKITAILTDISDINLQYRLNVFESLGLEWRKEKGLALGTGASTVSHRHNFLVFFFVII